MSINSTSPKRSDEETVAAPVATEESFH